MFRNFRPLVRALGLALGLAVMSAPASADPFVTCVQQQLKDLGYAPGQPDGRLSPQTKAAWQAMKQAQARSGVLAGLPALAPKTAIHWCRELPVLNGGLKRYLLSAAPVRILADAPNVEKGIRQAHDRVLRFMDREYGIVLAGHIGIAAAGGTKEVQGFVRHLLRDMSSARFNPDASIAAHCKNTFGVAGAAYLKFMYICWDNPHQADDAWLKRSRKWLGSMMAHEYMHLFQAELGGARSEGFNGRAVRARMGPAWLVEGSAEVVAARFGKKALRLRAPGLPELHQRSLKSQKSLNGMRAHKTVRTEGDYDLAHYAVHVLTRISGEEALFSFWRRLSTGQSWDQAFQGTFGLGMAEFEAQIMELRKRPGTERAYITKMRRRNS
ncbi:peptidoglycan-binding domain-containing protein [Leisingera sp. SS27]|uniref:peptidoglycan-binding domain-containing protein n=1 Tax=Leisingera sp. SS27 TaxID=2979462 RepID=UPI00232FC3E1|nr:peptidoglycan-binding domain-containing protein [Leisingera sp. SS27]MDC0658171.1 peptidoglycan-binding domain-containing protein [Leisingera sp. SS27]